MTELKYMNIKVPVQYDSKDFKGKNLEKLIEVTGDSGTTTTTEPSLPKHVNLKRVESAALYWHDGSECVTFKLGNIEVEV
jgi:hypothetical protein